MSAVRTGRVGGRRARPRGVAMIEALIGLPLVCLLGLAVLQAALLMHARDGLHYALLEAARAGSVAHGARAAIERGLARGLAPMRPAGSGTSGAEAAGLRAQVELQAGQAAGWVVLRRLAPTRESFADWGEPARDDAGAPRGGVEIPVDNLPTESRVRRPASGAAGLRAGAPIGRASGQTLADASLLQLELIYGVPVDVPLVGRLIARTLAAADGCDASAETAAQAPPVRLGAVDLGHGWREPAPRSWTCAFYQAIGLDGRARPRVPVRLTALIRMQTPPRLEPDTPTRAAAGAGIS